MDELRKILYKKSYNSEERKGYFHGWGSKAIEGIGGNFISVTYGIVEDAQTGKVLCVYLVDDRPGSITFKSWEPFE